MNTNDPLENDPLARKLRQRRLLASRREGDYLVLSDPVLRAAIDGTRHLTPAEAAALQASPLTLRRMQRLVSERATAGQAADATLEGIWCASAGMLRAAAGHAPLTDLATDDGWWRLHFIDEDGAWRVIVSLDPGAPFAAQLLREQPMLRVQDGGGAIVLHGRLDADGEYETRWPFELPPALHFQLFGAGFSVERASAP